MACGITLTGAPDGVPGSRIAPVGVDADHRVAPWSAVHAPEPPRALRQHASQPAPDPVDAAGDLTEGPISARLDQFTRCRLVNRLRGSAPAVPVAQQFECTRHRVGDHGIVDTSHEHGPERRSEGEAHKGHQRQHQTCRAQPRAEVRVIDIQV